ncbi:RusA family crossover junction endodeoxyribonuclease [Azospirillum sp. TSO5]|uniref:RusA family crossover junction endodeoxyribonuclease n=1 Tax=Azospirillum sp. TSO5 TaxID=716760 RepID=UPI000D60443A|nr:RusA family crossover junction endodeoxyribonuclease [Azospirillum sp. TSO5]PWC97721.1 hypothetical protein TSO5_04260 [Azospirillum sp. TSO5]
MLRIRLDGDLQGKGRPQFDPRTGRAYTPGQTRTYESDLRRTAQHAMRTAGLSVITGPVRVCLLAEEEVPESWARWKRDAALLGLIRPTVKPDADNIIKMLDALNPVKHKIAGKKVTEDVVWSDDAVVVEIQFEKHYSATPGLTVTVTPLNAAPAQITRASQLPAAPAA